MPIRMLLLALVFSSASFTTALRAADGVLLVQAVDDGSGATATSTQVRLEPTRVRTEVQAPNGRRQVVIFDGTQEVLYVVDPARQTFMEITKADAARMGGMMQGAMAMMQQQMANMPPEQRQMMEQKMGGMMGGAGMLGSMAAAARPEYKQVGTDTVGDWTCTRYDGYTSGQKTSELCTVEPKALGFAIEDFAVMGQLSEFVRSIMPQLGDQIAAVGTGDAGFTGLPVRTVITPQAGGRTITMQVTEARRATFDDSEFSVPSGFTRQAMPGMMPGM